MLDTSVTPKEVNLDWKSDGLRAKFGEKANDVTVQDNGHDHQNDLLLKAQTGNIHGDFTTTGKQKKKDEDKLHKSRSSRSGIYSPIIDTSININLTNIKLDNEEMVDINDDGVLMVRGEGEDSEFRAATLDEKIQLEETSQACSIGITEQEIEMNAYLRGETDVLPDALHQIAEKNGLLAEDVSRDEFKNLVTQHYADAPHVAMRINDTDMPLTSGTLSLDNLSLALPQSIPQTPVAISTPEPALTPYSF